MIHSKLIKQQTAQRLSTASYPPRRLALLHTGVTLACNLVLTVINYLLFRQMAGTGGLSGMGARAVLQTAQSILSIVFAVASPFWAYGFVAVVLRIARRDYAEPQDLMSGFRKFGPVARLLLLQTALYALLAVAATQISTIAVSMTPKGKGLMELMETLSANTDFIQYGMIPEDMMEPLLQALIPVYIGAGVLFAGAFVIVSYRLRLAPYIVMEEGNTRAFRALLQSNRTMRGNCLSFFKLDMSFWWYWLLQVVCSVVGIGDVLLDLLGVQLPFDADVAMFVFFGLQLVFTLVITWIWRATVETTYAVAYTTLAAKPEE